jgi:hypothetical protein
MKKRILKLIQAWWKRNIVSDVPKEIEVEEFGI